MTVLDVLSSCEQETAACAQTFARTLTGGEFLALKGDLGAGKTVFVRGLASVLAPEAAVSSPSYAVVHEYGGPLSLCHVDLYRVESEDDLYSVGFFDYEDCIMAVEWSERLGDLIPPARYEITITKEGDSRRRIRIEKLE